MAIHPSTRLESPLNREAWCATVHGVTKRPTGLSNFCFQPKKGGKDLRNVANNGLIVLSDWLDVGGEKRENSDQRLPNTSV